MTAWMSAVSPVVASWSRLAPHLASGEMISDKPRSAHMPWRSGGDASGCGTHVSAVRDKAYRINKYQTEHESCLLGLFGMLTYGMVLIYSPEEGGRQMSRMADSVSDV